MPSLSINFVKPNVPPTTPIDPTIEYWSQMISSAAQANMYPPEAPTSSTNASTGMCFSSANCRMRRYQVRLRGRAARRVYDERHGTCAWGFKGALQCPGNCRQKHAWPQWRGHADHAAEPNNRHNGDIAAEAARHHPGEKLN